MNFGEFLYIQPDNIKKQVRNIEKLEKKLANVRVAIVFNKTCLNENLLPTLTDIYIYILNVEGLPGFIFIQVLQRTRLGKNS